jgi:hypothetical protein
MPAKECDRAQSPMFFAELRVDDDPIPEFWSFTRIAEPGNRLLYVGRRNAWIINHSQQSFGKLWEVDMLAFAVPTNEDSANPCN